jgi:GntR family transcriptional regulator
VHGAGTFVTRTETAVTSRFDLDLGVTEAVVAANKKLDIQILRIADDHAAADVAERLEVPNGAPVLAVERVIRADDVPAAHALDVIPGSVLSGAARYEGGSVYRFLEERCGLELAGGMADVTAANAGRTLARQLGVSPGAAVLRMEQVERTADERAVLFSREHYVPTVFNLSVRRVRRRGPS